MHLWVNGKHHETEQAENLGELLQELGYTHTPQPTIKFVVAVNNTIVHCRDYPQTDLCDQDRIEIFGAITGG